MFSISDRQQTWRELRSVGESFFDGSTDQSNLLLREESPAWVEPPPSPAWLADGSFVWRSELPSGRNRLYHLSRDGAVVTPISPEQFDVQDFYVRADGTYAIVTGDQQGGTVERHAYRIELRNHAGPPTVQPITNEPGWHRTKTSADGEFIVDHHSTPTRPSRLLVRPTRGDSVKVIAAAELQVDGDLISPQIFRINTEDDIDLPAMLIRPRSASPQQPCPVVVEVYGGPQAPVVSARWGGTKTLYRELLARRGIATLVVDNRSSAGRGIADTWPVRGRLGEVELADLLTAVDWLKSQQWVRPDRIAVRGWSYGGFMTLFAMVNSDVFAAGIAGGSVTDWKEYDAFYTERYMGLPSENPEGYQSTSPLASAANLSGRVLLIHGEADDNVHPSGTYRMVDALQR
ncbi:MAG: prolyl oligopeptidase family serine peptidase, partial [Pirellulales bacterium]|nr:prolyl oligopeptidase family serine peptidase [Pirellulales bacterium]